jgi:hypothetical protein
LLRGVTPTTILLRAALALALLTPATAHAEPPEGCIGFPSIPQAFICITQWSPENAVPTVTPGPDQTVTIPEFCVFQCFGPTPVNVPSVVITQGDGVIARIEYDGQTHTVTVPPLGDPNQLVQQVVQTVTDAVALVLGLVAAPDQFTATVDYACYGCGGGTSGWLSGSFTGDINGQIYQNAPMSASFFASQPSGSSCELSGSASGSVYIGDQSASFSWTQTGNLLFLTFSGGFVGSATALHRVFSPVGNPCGTSATAAVTGAGQIG